MLLLALPRTRVKLICENALGAGAVIFKLYKVWIVRTTKLERLQWYSQVVPNSIVVNELAVISESKKVIIVVEVNQCYTIDVE